MRAWSPTMTWEDLANFCRRMTEEQKAIRRAGGIVPPRTRCPKCGAVSQSDIAGVTIRSALFALKKAGAISDENFEELDRSWRQHRARHRLDAYGRRRDGGEDVDGSAPCC